MSIKIKKLSGKVLCLRQIYFSAHKLKKDRYLRKGLIFYLLNRDKFKKIKLPLRLYKNIHISNKGNIEFGKDTRIYHNCFIEPVSLKIGDDCNLGVNNFIYGKVIMENKILIDPNVSIPGSNHIIKTKESIRTSGTKMKGTIIKDDVWIRSNSTILNGVTLGKGSVIGAGNVITKDVPKYTVVSGVPAKILRIR